MSFIPPPPSRRLKTLLSTVTKLNLQWNYTHIAAETRIMAFGRHPNISALSSLLSFLNASAIVSARLVLSVILCVLSGKLRGSVWVCLGTRNPGDPVNIGLVHTPEMLPNPPDRPGGFSSWYPPGSPPILGRPHTLPQDYSGPPVSLKSLF